MDFNVELEWLVTTVLAVAGIGIGLWQYVQARRRQLLVDLQGDKNAVAAVAMRVWSGRFPRWPTRRATRHRRELFEALCLAAVFQRSGRSRSLIYGALADAGQTDKYRNEVQEIVDRITVIVSRSWAHTDLHKARRSLIMLRAALGLDQDVRLRLDTFELNASTPGRDWPPDSRVDHPVFHWPVLAGIADQLASLVVIGSEGSTPVIALDYHRAARGREPERLCPTSLGAAVIQAKYGDSGDLTENATDRLAKHLAALVNTHPRYSGAACVAAVPGTQHDFSDRLGAAVATKTEKPFVVLTRGPTDVLGGLPRFTVDATGVKGTTVIVVDDVYRSGRTLQAAAAAVLDAGAEEVLGLTATCTVSAAEPPCHHDGPTDRT